MTSLSTTRDRVRLRLEDTTDNPLWTDAEIDEGLRVALDEYTDWSMDRSSVTVSASTGDRELPMPVDARQVVRVIDPREAVIPRRTSPARSRGSEDLAWEVWDGAILFTSQLMEGEYTIRYYRARSLPEDDAGDIPVPDEHVSVLVLRAALWCLERRGIEDWKRGPIQQRYTSILARTRSEYTARWRAMMGRIRTSHVEVSS